MSSTPDVDDSFNIGTTLFGDLLVFAAMAMFGPYSLFLRFFPTIPTLVFLLAFQIVGAVFLGLYNLLKPRESISKTGWLWLIALTVVAVGNDLCYFLAFRLTTVANAAVAHQTVSIFLLLLAPLLLKEKTTRAEWFALAAALIGVGILYSDNLRVTQSHDVLGISLALLSGLLYALLIVIYRRLNFLGLSVSTVNWWRYVFSSMLVLPVVVGCTHWQPNPHDLIVLLAFGVLFAVVAASLHIYAMSRTRAMHVSIIGKSEPVFAALFALLVLHEVPTPESLFGGIFIVGSGLWLTATGLMEGE